MSLVVMIYHPVHGPQFVWLQPGERPAPSVERVTYEIWPVGNAQPTWWVAAVHSGPAAPLPSPDDRLG